MKFASSLSYRVATRLFELAEEAFDTVSLLVEIGVVGALELAVAFRRDDDVSTAFSDLVAQMIGIIALVGNRSGSLDAIAEIVSEGDVVTLSGRRDQTNR